MLFKKSKSRRSEKNRFRRVFLEQLEDRRLLTGLVTVVDINQGNSGSDPSHFQFLGDSTVLFSAETTTLGRELWKTDGTTGGTLLVKDLSAGSSSSNPTDLTKVGDVIFFVADDENGLAQIWKTDGSGAGTQKISDFSGHIDPPRNLTALGNSLFFKLNTPANGTEPWISDGTSAGTVMLKDLVDGSFGSNPESTVIWNSKIYFRAQPGAGQPTTLWETDGTQAGTVNLGIPAEVVFKFEQGIVTKVGPTLRYYDGSATHLISSPNVIEIEGMVATNAQVYVGAKNNVEYGREVAVIDVDSKSLELVKDIRPGTGNSLPNGSTHRGLVGESLGSSLFFTAEGVNSSGFELWISDGTATGTELVSDMNPGANSSFPQWFVAHQGEMFFVNRFSGDFELTLNLWKSDGTTNGTVDVFAQESVNPKINIEPYSSDVGLMLNGWTENLGRELWIYSANSPPTLGALSDVTIAEDTAEQTVDLTGITAGGGETQPLRVTATSSNTDLIADPTVVYTSDEATGQFKFTPLADQHGTSTITVTVTDGGLDNNLATTADNATTTQTFDVTVNPINDDPVIGTYIPNPTNIDVGADGPGHIRLVDLNGDDFTDLVTSNGNSHSFSVLLGQADGQYSTPQVYNVGTLIMGIAIGDVNNDDQPDVAVAMYHTNQVGVYLGDADGSFSHSGNFNTPGGPFHLAIADFDGDDDGDIAVATADSDDLGILISNGDGSFQNVVKISVGDCPDLVIPADLNKDGKVDLAVEIRNGNRVAVLIGKGDGTFETAVHYDTGASPRGLTLGDFNNDGTADLATANYQSSNIGIALGNGDGTFNTAVNYATNARAESIVTVDFNNDGNQDLFVTQNNTEALFFRGDGQGGF
ncbi:MAG: hypothetical protein HOA14_11425, partial [Planctomycetaceae bacterium]|nr:hypothetical protein [Planctomycetaceae bacterium]